MKNTLMIKGEATRSMRIMNLNGDVIIEAGFDEKHIATGMLPKGAYVLQIITESGTKNFKIEKK